MIEFKTDTGIFLYEGSPVLEKYAKDVCEMIEEASNDKNAALALRTFEYIKEKISTGKAVVAIFGDEVIGFCYIETWEHGKFVANSGLTVSPAYRKTGLANKIKELVFRLSEKKFPTAKIFGLTTSLAVMKINSGLGYKPVTFSELTVDDNFWKGCETCKYFDVLQRTNRHHCLCTAMVFNPEWKKKHGKEIKATESEKHIYDKKSVVGF